MYLPEKPAPVLDVGDDSAENRLAIQKFCLDNGS
jgi:hypothetical protein